jgi:hypothetical protein
MRAAPGRVKITAMPDPTFHFTAIAGQRSWQVREGGWAGRLLGTLAESEGGYQATHVAPGGRLVLHWSADRDAAAAWLASMTPKHRR